MLDRHRHRGRQLTRSARHPSVPRGIHRWIDAPVPSAREHDRRPVAPGALAVALLAAWAFFPVVLIVVHADASHAAWTGADGLIGVDGVLGVDQLQYLAWARSIAGHGLASDLFTLGRSGHVFLEPLYGAVGGLFALGVPLTVGALLAKALATVALAGAAVLWCRRLAPARARPQLATLALALSLATPATSLIDWLGTGGARLRFDVYLAGDELCAATKLWGYAPAALSIALLAMALLALERGLASRRRGLLVAAAGAALLASWLHPWQGIVLTFVLVGLLGLRRERTEIPGLSLVLIAALVPLAYDGLLPHLDPAWRLAARAEHGPHLSAAVFALCLGPVLALAALGVRRPGPALAEQALLLWIPAALLAYLVEDSVSSHALQGISFPFAVLAVRGAARLRLAPVLGGLCVALLTLPGLAYDARKFTRTADSPIVQYALPDADGDALRWVGRHAPAGGVLAPVPFAAVVPARTGRAVWVGDGDWSPDYRRRARAVDRLFDDRLPPSAARASVAATGARILVADCAHPAPRLLAALASDGAAVHRFGCATVLVLGRPALRPGARPRR